MNKVLKRELEVAFSKDAQPAWFRIVKYTVLEYLLYFFRGTALFWISLLIIIVPGLILHFWYRHKTAGWTKSHGMGNHESARKN